MDKVKSGFAFHLHHNKLVEWCHDYDKRVEVILSNKPKKEQELRLRLFKLIPEDRLPPDLLKAGKAYDRARRKYSKATQIGIVKAFDTEQRKFDAYYATRADHQYDLEVLHKELCPDCPWNGETIFPNHSY
jgi:hypothetical protein